MIEIQISNNAVEVVRLRAGSAAEEDEALAAWRHIRDLIETAHDRLRRAGETE